MTIRSDSLKTNPVVSKVQNLSGLNIQLHPLVIMNISDHHTRAKMMASAGGSGTQTGREVEIINSFEIKVDIANDMPVIDKAFFLTKQDQYKQVFPKWDFLGWYSVGVEPCLYELTIHKQFTDFNESPLYLLLNPHVQPTSRALPLTLYESIIDIVSGSSPQLLFIPSSYKIITQEAERIAVDHVAHSYDEGGAGGAIIKHLVGQRNALKMLNSRVMVLSSYVQDVANGSSVF